MKKIAVFCDRDGTINKHVPYLREASDFELLPMVAESIKRLNINDFKVVVVTNQSGIGRGYFGHKDLRIINEKMQKDLSNYNSWIDGLYCCPHIPEENCICRKPKNGLLIQACDEMNLDLNSSFLIGDRETDIVAGAISSCRTVLVLTGYGETESKKISQWLHKPDFVAKDLFEAVTWILKNKITDKNRKRKVQ